MSYRLDSKLLCQIANDELNATFRVIDVSEYAVYVVPVEGNKIFGVWYFRKDQNLSLPIVTRLDLPY